MKAMEIPSPEEADGGECTEASEGPVVDGDDIFSCQFVSVVSGVLTNSFGQYFGIIL